MASSGVYRGQYGPTPKQVLPLRILWARRLEALWCGWIARHLIRARASFRPLSTEDAQLLALAIRQANFEARSVTGCPAGYRLESAHITPYSKDVLTLAFTSSAGYRFELVERPAWIAVREQLETAQVPFTSVPTGGVRLHVVHGRHGGEPIDRSFWPTRRAVMWEREGLLLEMREVIGRGPGLATLMALAGRIVAGEAADRPPGDNGRWERGETDMKRDGNKSGILAKVSSQIRGAAATAKTSAIQPTRRKVLIGGTAAAGIAALAGKAPAVIRSARAQGGPFRVAMLLPSFDQQRWKDADGAFFMKRAQQLGMEPLPLQSSNNDPILQASQVENLLNQQIDGLVLVAVNVDAAVASVQRANDAGVPVVAHNYVVPNVKLAGVSARDGVELGFILGAAMLEVAPKGNYIVNKGDEGTDIARLKAQGGYEAIDDAVQRGDIKIVSDQWMMAWSGDLARKQVEQALTATNNDIAAVLSYCDCQAYGVIEALRAQGLAGKIPVSGEDGEPEMLRLILAGDAYVTAWTKFDEMGVRSAELLHEALTGTPTSAPATFDNGAGEWPWYKIAVVNVTKDGKAHRSITVAEFAEQNPWWVSKEDLGL